LVEEVVVESRAVPGPASDAAADSAADIARAAAQLQAVRDAVARVIVGQDALITRLLITLLSDGHCLLEGVPGLAKSLSVSTIAGAIDAHFVRLQFTPDLLPADLTGTEVYNTQSGEFEVRRGPIFANIVLADEINRAPAKVQSALLEAMQERHVSIGGETIDLPRPFMVLATQNPIEQEGTYPLPEAQLDRFMLKVLIDYPVEREERQILERHLQPAIDPPQPVLRTDDLLTARAALNHVLIEDPVRDYVVRLVRATREPGLIDRDLDRLVEYGASPRASIYLAQAGRAHAFLEGRGHTTPDDIKAIAPDVLRHRLIISYEAEADNVTSDLIIQRILEGIAVR
jgi:MoxR-like ATPase